MPEQEWIVALAFSPVHRRSASAWPCEQLPQLSPWVRGQSAYSDYDFDRLIWLGQRVQALCLRASPCPDSRQEARPQAPKWPKALLLPL